MSRLTASRAAFDLIASFEGFRTRAALAPDGQWTLGFGHTATAREGLTVSRAEAEDLLRWDLLPIEDMVRQSALTPLSQNQFDALVSFAFNIGIESYRTSDVLKYLNQGQPVAAALSMHAWRRAPVNGQVLTIDALVRRRAAESALFLETIGARPAAPSSVVRPQIDYSATILSHAPETESETGSETLPVEAHDDAPVQKLEPEPAPQEADQGQTGIEPPPIEPPPVEPHLVEIAAPAETSEPSQTPAPLVTLADAVSQDVLWQADERPTKAVSEQIDLSQGPVVLPPLPIPPLADPPDTRAKASILLQPLLGKGPIVPDGLSPFPGSAVYTPANGTSDTITAPANDGINTRLHNTPEILDVPQTSADDAAKAKVDSDNGFSLLVWGLMILGAALLAFGLYFSWKSGILTVASPRRDPSMTELAALLAAASGFIILVTSAVSALTGERDQT